MGWPGRLGSRRALRGRLDILPADVAEEVGLRLRLVLLMMLGRFPTVTAPVFVALRYAPWREVLLTIMLVGPAL